jgi:hypothetical protein
MADVILISELVELGFGSKITEPHTKNYMVTFVRTRDDGSLKTLLKGKTFADLEAGAILEHGTIHPPDGTLLDGSALGHPAITSYEEALQIAKAALTNPNSEIFEKRFEPDTQIYFAMKGQPYERLND